jgi:hypothetical protein
MEDRSWMYHGSGGDPLLYFNQVTQFVEAAKIHACHMKKKLIRCPCKNCKNNVSWIRAETNHEHLFEKGFIGNYSIWTKHSETGENAQGNNTEHEREEGNDDSDHVFRDNRGGDSLDVEELLHNIQHEETIFSDF